MIKPQRDKKPDPPPRPSDIEGRPSVGSDPLLSKLYKEHSEKARNMTTEKPFTVGKLIKALVESGCDPSTPVWLVGMHGRPAKSLTITTAADPVSGRMSGDPDGPTVVVIE